MTGAKWPSGIGILFGVWLFLSPFIFGYGGGPRADDWILGVVIALLSAWRTFGHAGAWASYLNVVLGVWVFLIPFMYADWGAPAASEMIAGLGTVVLAILSAYLLMDNERRLGPTFASAEPEEAPATKRPFENPDGDRHL